MIKPTTDTDAETAWISADTKAMSDFIFSIVPEDLKHIKDCAISKEV